ncbi:hypothetical protein [Halioxenophilus sp. WMMB6]|uniref:lipopolysaccharide biosynthesis protein n=1 Tax=Halioxenophilus sp. WMMB6 TaxID=3073815 RepID=UPI00295F5995|nr:hypothetical protein [Halioxenophilus sp. WMMB6]
MAKSFSAYFSFLLVALVKVGSAAANFLVAVVISKKYPPEIAATFFFIQAFTLIVVGVSKLGLDNYSLRLESRIHHSGRLTFIRESLAVCFFSGVFFSFLSYVGLMLYRPEVYVEGAGLVLLVSPCIACSYVLAFFSQARGRFVAQHCFLGLAANSIFLALVFSGLNFGSVFWIYGVSWFVVFLFGFAVYREDIFLIKYKLSINKVKKLVRYSTVFWGVGILSMLMNWLPIFVSGFLLQNPEEVKAIAMSLRASLFIVFPLSVLGALWARRFASLYKQKQSEKLFKLYIKSTCTSLFMAIPILVGLIVFSEEFLRFCDVDTVYSPVFRIILVCQIIGVACGPIGLLMNMIGQERVVFLSSLFAVFFGFFVVVISYGEAGVYGVAYGVVSIILISNLLPLARYLAGMKLSEIIGRQGLNR